MVTKALGEGGIGYRRMEHSGERGTQNVLWHRSLESRTIINRLSQIR